MAGHSKWANIRHRKGAQDAKRGKIFTKLAKEITVAAKIGGEDQDSNPRLRAAVAKARSQSMPRDNIERAIKKGIGGDLTGDYSEKTYEGYGPAGVAIIAECLTDNVNRTVSEVRHAFSRSGGNLGTDGSVAWMFHKKGQIVYKKAAITDYDKMFEVAIENGAEDVIEESEFYEIQCEPSMLLNLKDALDKLEIVPEVAEVNRVPENTSPVDSKRAEQLIKLIDALEDCDDVQNVYHNGEFTE